MKIFIGSLIIIGLIGLFSWGSITNYKRYGSIFPPAPQRLTPGTKVIMFDGREGVIDRHTTSNEYRILYTDNLGQVQYAYLDWNETFRVKK